ncbi:hypothetical protein STSP2_02990 [Anaerohalosphaera lusitana]|uniref:Methane oxygenase PmoA n=1 Tax=Anaerohalosphaera lusitana TaxID=1936003 RepID=A0A1U9NPE9_9BACT|nr:PmoA family protein [Anaerohalosphaera lusitana]AQT69793.1 hypothetical protein STSP2_02990 [Anaerohalosphaera lusitana]
MNIKRFTANRSLLLTCIIAAASSAASPAPRTSGTFAVQKNAETITLSHDSSNILTYHHATHPVPDHVDPLYRRSAFIHPLYSPTGRVLTRIQPPDHYHHYGIWNPWTKTRIAGRQVDFWNLGKGQGTVRFNRIESTTSDPNRCGFTVRHDHVQLKGPHAPRTAIDETWTVRASATTIHARKAWVVDLTSTLKNVLDVPITLDQYRYGGGLGFRATEQWQKDNTTVLTSKGKTRTDADGTRARWCSITGSFDDPQQTSGILFLSHPDNRRHPEPMRVWPENSVGGRGDMFFEFCPIRHKEWILEPGKEYTLKYRMIVYDGKIDTQTAEALWHNFAAPQNNVTQQQNSPRPSD